MGKKLNGSFSIFSDVLETHGTGFFNYVQLYYHTGGLLFSIQFYHVYCC